VPVTPTDDAAVPSLVERLDHRVLVFRVVEAVAPLVAVLGWEHLRVPVNAEECLAYLRTVTDGAAKDLCEFYDTYEDVEEEGPPPPPALDGMEALVFEALRTMTGWQTAQPIAERLGKAPSTVGGALRNLVWKELVVQDGRHKRYRLVTQKDAL
jgi:hypothetical protein